jgi:hypothetical protein
MQPNTSVSGPSFEDTVKSLDDEVAWLEERRRLHVRGHRIFRGVTWLALGVYVAAFMTTILTCALCIVRGDVLLAVLFFAVCAEASWVGATTFKRAACMLEESAEILQGIDDSIQDTNQRMRSAFFMALQNAGRTVGEA